MSQISQIPASYIMEAEINPKPKAASEAIKPLMGLLPKPIFVPTIRPLMGLLPEPIGVPAIPNLLGLLPLPMHARTIPKPSVGPIKPLMELKLRPEIKPLMELKLRPEIKPLMELKLRPEIKPLMKTTVRLNPTSTKPNEATQPNSKPASGNIGPTAGTIPDAISPIKNTGRRRRYTLSRPKRPFQRFTSPGGTRRWIRVTTRWLEYSPVGNPLRGTPFICFKTPLKPTYDRKLHPKDKFGVAELVNIVPNLGLVIDLTATERYVDVNEYRKRGIKFRKVTCQGAVVPNIKCVKSFFNVVDEYVMLTVAAGKLIGVNCTHGLNRTGYLVCRYMIQRLGFPPDTAISEFEDARGHSIERKEYVEHLKTNLGIMPFYVSSDGLELFLKSNFGPRSTNIGIPPLDARNYDPNAMMNVSLGDGLPMNRELEVTRQPICPPERDNYQQWKTQPPPSQPHPTQLPAGDLRERLSSSMTRNTGSHFYSEGGITEMPQVSSPEKPFQRTFYPKGGTGNQMHPMNTEPNLDMSSEMRAGMETRPRPHQLFLPRGISDQRAGGRMGQQSHKNDHFQQGFYESNHAMNDMGGLIKMKENYDIGPNEHFPVDQVGSIMSSRSGPMQRSEISMEQGRPRMIGESGLMQRDEDVLARDQVRPSLLGQGGPIQQVKDMIQVGSRMYCTGGPMQRDEGKLSLDQGRPGMLGQTGPMKRDEHFQMVPDSFRSGDSVLKRLDEPIGDAMHSYSSTGEHGEPILNIHVGSKSSPGPNIRMFTRGGGSRANYPDETPEIRGRIDFPINKSPIKPEDEFALNPINSNVYDRMVNVQVDERSSRERTENQFSMNNYRTRSRSRDRRRSRSRSISRRRSRDGSGSRLEIRNQFGKDLFTRRGEGGDGRSRSRDQENNYENDFQMGRGNEREPQRSIVESYQDYELNPSSYERSRENEIITHKLEHISVMATQISKAVNLIRSFNFPQEFYDNPDNSDFIFRARKFQSLSNEIQKSLENFNTTFEEHRPHSILSKKTVKLEPSQYRKLQPPPEFVGLAEPERPAEHTQQFVARRGFPDSQPIDYYSLRGKFDAPSRN